MESDTWMENGAKKWIHAMKTSKDDFTEFSSTQQNEHFNWIKSFTKSD